MRARDRAFVLILVAFLVVIGGAVVAPAVNQAAPSPTPAPTPVAATGHVQGVVGRPSSITPVTARTQVDRDLVALLFRGLVRLGPGTSVLPDIAGSWTVDKKGARWTFWLRRDARWHDGTPVTSADVVYTVRVLQHPDYAGALAATWAEVRATALGPYAVRFDLGDPVGGFLQAATLPLLPAHLLADVPVAELADDEFARSPIGNGPFALVELTDSSAVLEPVLPRVDSTERPLDEPRAGEVAIRTPRLDRLELRFFGSPAELVEAFSAGEVESAADLLPADGMQVGEAVPGVRVIRYPATTLTAIAFNLRSPGGPFADQRTRRALLAAIDREALLDDVLGGAGTMAATPIPPSSWAYDPAASAQVAHDRAAAAKGLRDAGWTRTASRAWIPPRASTPLEITLLAPSAAVNPVVNAVAERVADAWTGIGLATSVEALPAGAFVERLRAGDFTAAIVDVNVGLDPDPYPILASSQAREGGSNIAGVQAAALDQALAKARLPGATEARRAAYSDLQKLLGSLQPMPALFFRDVVMVAGPELTGPVARAVADSGDRFWDVLRWEAGR